MPNADEEKMFRLNEEERICRERGDIDETQSLLGYHAVIYQNSGNSDMAMKLLKEQERMCREIEKKDDLSICIGNQALILQSHGKFDDALKLFKEQEQICRGLGNKSEIAESLKNQAYLLARYLRQHQKALPLANEAHKIAVDNGLADLAKEIKSVIEKINLSMEAFS
jgi:tetratricopeptide (TPR) repeat protein